MSFLLTVRQIMAQPLSKRSATEAAALFWRLGTASVRTRDMDEAMLLLKHHMDQNYQYTDAFAGRHLLVVKRFNGRPYRYLGVVRIHKPTKDAPELSEMHLWANMALNFDFEARTKLCPRGMRSLFTALASGTMGECELARKNIKPLSRFVTKQLNNPNAPDFSARWEEGGDGLVLEFTKGVKAVTFLTREEFAMRPTYEGFLRQHGAEGALLRSVAVLQA